MMSDYFNAVQVLFQLEPGAIAPTKTYPTDAGWDLFIWKFLESKEAPVIDTGVHVLIPEGYVGLIYPRSSMNKAHYVTPIGVIDAGYTGTIKVVQWKPDVYGETSDDWLDICFTSEHFGKQGERVAQLIIHKLPQIEFVQGDVTSHVTNRGQNGFGSSGK